MNIDDVYFGKSELFFGVHVKTTFVLTSAVHFKIWKLVESKTILHIHVASSLWFAHYGMGNMRGVLNY